MRDDKTVNSALRTIAAETNGAAGLIVASLDGSDKAVRFWTGATDREFGGEESECPQIFTTAAGADRCAARLNSDDTTRYPGETWQPILWAHPDAGAPLDKYLMMTGMKFVGSTRR